MLALVPAIAFHQAPSSLLQHVRKALTVAGAAPWQETKLSGTAEYYGIKDDYSLDFLPDGRFAQKLTGEISESFGFEGSTFWRIDCSRGVQKLDFEDRDRVMAISILITGAWLRPDCPIKISQEQGKLHLKFKSSGQEEILKVDAKTWLPAEATLPVSSGTLVVKFDDWKPAGDRRVPMRVRVTEGGQTDTFEATKAEPVSPDLSEFAVPAWDGTDVVFDPQIPAKVETRRAISGHVLVHPLVNGKDVGWFILDSGAEITVIDKTTADQLKLDSVGHNPLTGVGGTIQSSFRPIDDLKLGPATVSKLLVAEFDLGQIGQILGIKLAGVIGSDFFRRAIVSIDLKGSSVEISGRPGFSLPGGKWLPVRFSSGNPAVEASLEGAPKSWFRFDTGADGTVALHSPFVKKWKLLEGRATSPAGMGGVGGVVTARRGQIKWFELAGHRFENPTIMFATATQGAFAEPYLAGNIGQEFMMPFRVVLDFTGYRLALIPRP